ncbi:hypothetical protein BJ997_003796 [Cryobacterium roopkundense]|uniref:Polyketide cyclase n=1 Tax=Cryobacterium roopkundense TaxID=1001240 RepID=A0A7W8ZZS5_9MICO|nr:hypothetical protein [Cryobacterium roopkundense]
MSEFFEFRTVWRVPGTIAEVADILGDAATLPRWWPSVYLAVEQGSVGDSDGVGSTFTLYTKGWLPYTLRWTLTVTEPLSETGFALTARGDLTGGGQWQFEQDGPETVVTYDWRVTFDKAWLRRFVPVFRPVFAANHRWAMARGEESLRLELRRRRVTSPAARQLIPRPPGPTFRRRRGRATSGRSDVEL